MKKTNRRTEQKLLLIHKAVCEIMASGKPNRFTIKNIARTAGLSIFAVYRCASSPWRFIEIYDGWVVKEFQERRAIQKDIGVGDRGEDFFMPLRRPSTII